MNKSTYKLTAICHVITTREVDPRLARMFVFVLFRAPFGSHFPSAPQNTLFFVTAFHTPLV